jgi:hypothetical protein
LGSASFVMQNLSSCASDANDSRPSSPPAHQTQAVLQVTPWTPPHTSSTPSPFDSRRWREGVARLRHRRRPEHYRPREAALPHEDELDWPEKLPRTLPHEVALPRTLPATRGRRGGAKGRRGFSFSNEVVAVALPHAGPGGAQGRCGVRPLGRDPARARQPPLW